MTLGKDILTFSRHHFEEAVSFITGRTRHTPAIGLVLGSGLGGFANEIEDVDRIPYGEIPHWPVSTVEGHSGELLIGRLQGHKVMVMRGRAHFYEGYSISQVTFPIRVMQLLGIQTLFLTNAAGGIRKDLAAGDLMLIADHINLIGLSGTNPLRGPNDSSLGPRFPDMNQVYSPKLRAIARKVAIETGIPLKEGVYVTLAGPSFETPAELQFLRLIGADAVGMSTAPEAIVARHGSMEVMGISGISNIVQMEPSISSKTTHEEVLETGQLIVPQLLTLLKGILAALPTSTAGS